MKFLRVATLGVAVLAAIILVHLLWPSASHERFDLTCISQVCLLLDRQTGQVWRYEHDNFVPVYVEKVPSRNLYEP